MLTLCFLLGVLAIAVASCADASSQTAAGLYYGPSSRPGFKDFSEASVYQEGDSTSFAKPVRGDLKRDLAAASRLLRSLNLSQDGSFVFHGRVRLRDTEDRLATGAWRIRGDLLHLDVIGGTDQGLKGQRITCRLSDGKVRFPLAQEEGMLMEVILSREP